MSDQADINWEEKKMFGMTTEEVEKLVKNSYSVKILPIQLMSDCQELLDFKDARSKESIRQILNMAKYITDNYLIAK